MLRKLPLGVITKSVRSKNIEKIEVGYRDLDNIGEQLDALIKSTSVYSEIEKKKFINDRQNFAFELALNVKKLREWDEKKKVLFYIYNLKNRKNLVNFRALNQYVKLLISLDGLGVKNSKTVNTILWEYFDNMYYGQGFSKEGAELSIENFGTVVTDYITTASVANKIRGGVRKLHALNLGHTGVSQYLKNSSEKQAPNWVSSVHDSYTQDERDMFNFVTFGLVDAVGSEIGGANYFSDTLLLGEVVEGVSDLLGFDNHRVFSKKNNIAEKFNNIIENNLRILSKKNEKILGLYGRTSSVVGSVFNGKLGRWPTNIINRLSLATPERKFIFENIYLDTAGTYKAKNRTLGLYGKGELLRAGTKFSAQDYANIVGVVNFKPQNSKFPLARKRKNDTFEKMLLEGNDLNFTLVGSGKKHLYSIGLGKLSNLGMSSWEGINLSDETSLDFRLNRLDFDWGLNQLLLLLDGNIYPNMKKRAMLA